MTEGICAQNIAKAADCDETMFSVCFVCCICWYCSCSVTKSGLALCHLMNCSTSGFSVLHHLLELAQIHVH